MAPSPPSRRLPLRREIRLLRYARPYLKGWGILLVATLLASGVALLQPWPMQVLIDGVIGDAGVPATVRRAAEYLPGADTKQGLLTYAVLAGLVIALLGSIIEMVLSYVWARVGQGMVHDLSRDVYALIQRRSLREHSRGSIGDAMGRIHTDSWCLYSLVDLLLVMPVGAVVVITSMVWVMASINPRLTLVSLIAAPLMAGGSLLLGKRIRTAARARREVESRMQSHVQQTLAGIHVVQAFGQEEREDVRFREYASAALRIQARNVLFGNISRLWTGLVTTAGTAVVLLVGAHQVLDGALTVGTLLVFLQYLGVLQGKMTSLAASYNTLQTLRAQVDRVSEVLESPPEVGDGATGGPGLPGAVKGHVVIENVTFGYEKDSAILKGISLAAHPGETIAIVGPTGAGKSTLVGLIPRFFDPWEGRVLLDGQDLRRLRLREVREQIGIVLQEPFLFPVTVARNIAYGRPDATIEQIESAAREANAHEFINQLPEGYQTIIGERGTTLSGGQRQRLAIARALLKNAPVLILDEPTSALDAQTEELLVDALRRLMKGRTTFIIAHRLSTIRGADRIIVLEEGRIVEEGRHDQLMARGGLYARFHEVQCCSAEC